MAAASLLRSVTGCILPIFSDSLFKNLGYGWGGTLLALVSIVSAPFFSSFFISLALFLLKLRNI